MRAIGRARSEAHKLCPHGVSHRSSACDEADPTRATDMSRSIGRAKNLHTVLASQVMRRKSPVIIRGIAAQDGDRAPVCRRSGVLRVEFTPEPERSDPRWPVEAENEIWRRPVDQRESVAFALTLAHAVGLRARQAKRTAMTRAA